MPFIGKDWRANGEQWTKTEIGSWQRIRRDSVLHPSNGSLSDIFNALEMVNAVSNPRRVNYITKIIQILFNEKLGELSGNAQRSVFQVLEKMIDTVIENGDNLSRMQRLIDQFQNSIHSQYPYFYYIGSAALWQGHVQMLERLHERLEAARKAMIEKKDESKMSNLDRLPMEMQFEILKRLDNGQDLVQMGMINSTFYRVTQELTLWKQLCHYHFNDNNARNEKILRLIRRQQKENEGENIDWKKIFFRLKKRHGLRETYAEMICQCQSCKSFLWQSSTEHSCPHQSNSMIKPLSPRKFLSLLL